MTIGKILTALILVLGFYSNANANGYLVFQTKRASRRAEAPLADRTLSMGKVEGEYFSIYIGSDKTTRQNPKLFIPREVWAEQFPREEFQIQRIEDAVISRHEGEVLVAASFVKSQRDSRHPGSIGIYSYNVFKDSWQSIAMIEGLTDSLRLKTIDADPNMVILTAKEEYMAQRSH